MDVLLLNRYRVETRQTPVLSKILERIKSYEVIARCQKRLKETRYKLAIEMGIICNGEEYRMQMEKLKFFNT